MTDWKELVGKRVLVMVIPAVNIPQLDTDWYAIYEVEVKEVSPSGKYVKFEGELKGWRLAKNWVVLEVLEQ